MRMVITTKSNGLHECITLSFEDVKPPDLDLIAEIVMIVDKRNKEAVREA